MYTAAVITVSDKGFRGERVDTSGPNLVNILKDKGFNVTYTAIVPDEREMIKRSFANALTKKRSPWCSPPAARAFPPGISPRRLPWRWWSG